MIRKLMIPMLALIMGLMPVSLTAAERPLSPSEFRDYAEGWTLQYQRDGKFWGSERYEPGGVVRWRFPDGRCVEGLWRPHGAQICFLYGSDAEVLCWRMLRDEQGLMARLLGDGPDAGMELRIIGRERASPLCGGPGEDT